MVSLRINWIVFFILDTKWSKLVKNKVFRLTILTIFSLLFIFASNYAYSEEIKYNFTSGAIYTYEYTRQDVSVVNALNNSPQKSSSNQIIDFDIKVVGFQDNVFILDIGDDNSRVRRYISNNGALRGAPSESKMGFPYFIIFPEGDWSVGTTVNQKDEFIAFGKQIPVIWTLTLKKVDKLKNLADIIFEAKFNIPDDKVYSKSLAINGQLTFNMAEGVIHEATWKTNYVSKLICKENAITRDLWNFQKQTAHLLKMTGVEK